MLLTFTPFWFFFWTLLCAGLELTLLYKARKLWKKKFSY